MSSPRRRRACAPLLVGISVLLGACPSRQEPPQPPADTGASTSHQEPEVAAEPDAAREPDAAATTAGPDAPARPLFVSDDGLVRAPLPEDDAQWECVRQTSQPPTPPTTLIKCRQRESDRFFFLLAKDYEVAPAQRRDADAIVREVLPMTYDRLFDSFEITSTTAVAHQGVEGREVLLKAVHASLGEILKRERIFVRGDHVMVVSAEGRPAMFDAVAADVDAWFAGAEFVNLAD